MIDNCVAPEEEKVIDKHDVPEPVVENLNVVDPAGEVWGDDWHYIGEEGGEEEEPVPPSPLDDGECFDQFLIEQLQNTSVSDLASPAPTPTAS